MNYSNTTILIVDDEPYGQELLEAILVPDGFQCEFASNGPEALAKAREIDPDIILLDVMMPGMTGYEVCERLRAEPNLAEVPVILVTALNDRESWIQGIEVGADDFVSKPVDRTEIRTRVRSVTRLNRYRRLRTERTKFEWVVEHASEGYLILNTEDHIQYANQKARLYLGLEDNNGLELAGSFLEVAQRHYNCHPAEGWATFHEQADSQVSIYLLQPETPTSNPVWLQVDTLQIEPPSTLNNNRIIRLRDVTAEKMLQMEQWRFQSTISHKLRTPLSGMVYSMKLLADEGASLLPAEVEQIAQMSYQSIQRLQDDLEGIIKYMDSGNLPQHGLGFQLLHLKIVALNIATTLGLKNITVTGYKDVAHVRLPIPSQSIEVILGELLQNAKKFHPEQAPTIEVIVQPQPNNQISIQVVDDGTSLSSQQLIQMWEPYFQAEKHFTGEVPGMGLGLSMIAHMIWEVGGTCRAYNRSGKPGIIIELNLPLQ